MGKKRNKNKGSKHFKPETFNKKKLKNAIITIFYGEPARTFNYKQISDLLGIRDAETRVLIHVVLQELFEDEYLDQIARGKYKLKARSGSAAPPSATARAAAPETLRTAHARIDPPRCPEHGAPTPMGLRTPGP